MSNSNAIRAGRAFVEFFGDASKLEAVMGNIGRKLKAFGSMVAGWGKAMAAAGAAITAPIVAGAKAWADAGFQISKISQQTGASVEAISSLGFAASRSMTDIDSLGTGLIKMEKFLNGAASGADGASDALFALGLSIDQLRGKSPDEQFKMIADALSKVGSASERTALTLQIFGKGGAELIPLLLKGREGIEALQKQAEELGLVMSGPAAKAAAELHESYEIMFKSITGVWKAAGSIVAPILQTWTESVTRVAINVRKFLKDHKDLVQTVFLVGIGLTVAGTALFVFGKAIIFGVAAVSGLWTAMTTLWSLMAAIGGGIATIFTSPLLLSVAAVVALGGAFLWLSGAGNQAIEWLGERLGDLSRFAREAFGGIADALSAGDIELAAKILWKSLEVAWQVGVNKLEDIWESFKFYLKVAVVGAFEGTLAAIEEASHQIKSIWLSAIDVVTKAWIGLKDIIIGTVIDSMASAAKIVNSIRSKLGLGNANSDDEIDKWASKAKSQFSSDNQSQLSANSQMTADQQAAEDKAYEAAMAAIGAAFDKYLDKAAGERGTPDLEGLSALRKEFEELIEEAKKRRASAAGGLPQSGAPDVPDFDPGISSAKQAVFGTFSPAAADAAGRVQGGNIMSRVATATEQTAKNTSDMNSKLADFIARNISGIMYDR